MGPRHIPPSRRRYEASNPTVTARLSGDLFAALNEFAENDARSLSDVVRGALTAYLQAEPSGSEDDSEDDMDEEPAHGPEDHPEFLKLKAQVKALQFERFVLQQYLQAERWNLKQYKETAERAQAQLQGRGGPLSSWRRSRPG